MKKFYSIVLMATMLLVGTNAWAVDVSNATEFENAWKSATTNATTTIRLTNDIELEHTLWLGSATMGGKSYSITLDLNGWVLSNNAAVSRMFFITKGELNVISSRAGGQLIQQNWKSSTQELFRITGSNMNDINPKTAESCFTHVTIGEGVIVDAQKQNAIVIDNMNGSNGPAASAVAAGDVATRPTYSTGKLANGVRVDIYGAVKGTKYAFKVNGNVVKPTTAPDTTAYSPYIYLHSTSDMSVPATNDAAKKPVAVYASGYARWLIEGHCVGATAVYVKSGEVDINDAIVESNYTGTYVAPTGTTSGVTASGSAIVIESNTAYSGAIDVEISGDTKVSATNGYAIDEKVTTATNTKVETITISGGTFEGGQVPDPQDPTQTVTGIMTVSEMTAVAAANPDTITTITIIGGQTGEGESTIGNQDLADYLTTQTTATTHITTVTDENGKTTMVISEGNPPAAVTEWTDIAQLAEGTDANWTGFVPGVIGDGSKDTVITLGELQINSGYDATHTQELTIKNNATLEVNHLIMNAYAQIIVEAGGKLIVTGDQGIVAPSVNNIVLKNEGALTAADRKHATFLFKPTISSNRHPNATVELTTYSFANSATDYQWERFGVPTHNAVKSISSAATVPTAFSAFVDGAWQSLGYLNYPGHTDVNPADFNKPFVTYEMMANRTIDHAAPAIGPKYQFAGELVGNDNASLNVYAYWTPFTNSYAAEIDLAAMLNTVKAANIIDEYVYVALPGGLGSYVWSAIEDEDAAGQKLAPMQAFILKKTLGSTETESIDLNYNNMVYLPATSTPNHAPRRSLSDDYSARLRVVVENEQGVWDKVKLCETATRTRAAEKYMNADVNIYAMSDMKDAILATENLENTYVGFSTVKGGKFIISFADVEGREFTLIDHETGAQVAMVEGNTYEFTADANSTNDYRFEIVEPAKLPTAIENTEAVKSAKGIYTLTGQYMGEMNVWNSLPAGVYVVNGEKRVK